MTLNVWEIPFCHWWCIQLNPNIDTAMQLMMFGDKLENK